MIENVIGEVLHSYFGLGLSLQFLIVSSKIKGNGNQTKVRVLWQIADIAVN